MNAKRILLAALIAVPIPAGHGRAQEIGQAGQGLALAERLCARASTAGITSMALSAALQTSHASMPNIMLEAEERADLIAYIISLKRH